MLAFASILLLCGLFLVWKAKTRDFEESEGRLQRHELVNITRSDSDTRLKAVLATSFSEPERALALAKLQKRRDLLKDLPNVGELAKISVTVEDVGTSPDLGRFAQQLQEANARLSAQAETSWSGAYRFLPSLFRPKLRAASVPLFSAAEVARIKPILVVRLPQAWTGSLIRYWLLYFAAFWLLHSWWSVRNFGGDTLVLPLIQVLTGTGLLMMTSFGDPLRDTLRFPPFATGIIAGCILMGVLSLIDYEQKTRGLSLIFLIAGILLGGALFLFGTGRGSETIKVNLFGIQPVEVIRVLVVFFLAGYFSDHWDLIRQLRQPVRWLSRFGLGRLDYVLPVFVGVVVAVAIFFAVSDLGPALVLIGLFLVLYSIACGHVRLAASGLGVFLVAVVIGYHLGHPETVVTRIDMWLSKWNNNHSNGGHLAHSMWALSAGGVTGTGLGLGEPEFNPEHHTDMILPSIGEELGFLGLMGVFLVYTALGWRCVIARRTRQVYSFFLTIGLLTEVALQLLLITAGVLGAAPLSGVACPFLSFGKTSMVMNFAVLGMILSNSAGVGAVIPRSSFESNVRIYSVGLAVSWLGLAAYAGWAQVIQKDAFLTRPALVKGTLVYNPRIFTAARLLPRGDILDRNGLLLATSESSKIQHMAQHYLTAGINIVSNLHIGDRRHYPLGPYAFYLLGDIRSFLRRGTSSPYLEYDATAFLRGYELKSGPLADGEPDALERPVRQLDFSPLIPLMRHRNEPDHPDVLRMLSEHRDLRMTIDARLQVRVSHLIEAACRPRARKGAAVVLDAATGELLASVSYPWPSELQMAGRLPAGAFSIDETDLIDRARTGLYPPGSSFKVVTSIAALRKDIGLSAARFDCIPLPGGRTGNFVRGYSRPVRDDMKDRSPHGSVDMRAGLVHSCNAYFAQLGTYRVGAAALQQTAASFGIAMPGLDALQHQLPFAAYGQGDVLASPFQMARVAAAVANGGTIVQGHWISGSMNRRSGPPIRIISEDLAGRLAGYMRDVVTSGTARTLASSEVPIAGKTGTAETGSQGSHAWFIGFAPSGPTTGRRIAFAVLIEHGGYGGDVSAPIAGSIVRAAADLGLVATSQH
jgi:cell division protein FtsW (lipid II flippase)